MEDRRCDSAGDQNVIVAEKTTAAVTRNQVSNLPADSTWSPTQLQEGQVNRFPSQRSAASLSCFFTLDSRCFT